MKVYRVGIAAILTVAGLGFFSGTSQAARWQSLHMAGCFYNHDNMSEVINRISAKWVQPKVRVHGYRNRYAVLFAGFTDVNHVGALDRQGGEPEVGTEADSISGHARYFAWYSPPRNSRNPAAWIRLKNSVRPGDRMSASVTRNGPGLLHYILRLSDIRYSHNRIVLRWAKTERLWGVESNDGAVGIAPIEPTPDGQPALADFKSVKFTEVKLEGNVIGSYESGVYLTDLIWVTPHGYVHHLAATSALGPHGDSFTVTYHRSQ